MKRNILVPIDFSFDSINALEHAISIANKIGANIRMINVRKSHDIEIPDYFKDFNFVFGKSIEGYFDILVQKYKKKVKGEFDYKIREGRVYKEITNQAKYEDSYMIIMGTHGISGFEEYWIGSNAYKVVSDAPCPVLTIRKGFPCKPITKIVAPIDISKESRLKISYVADFAALFNAEVHVVTVRETNARDILERLKSYAAQSCEYIAQKKIKCVLKDLHGENITNISIDYAKEIGAQMIAVMTEQSENTSNLWLGAYAQQMVNHSPIPVLSLRAEVLEK
ncbi:MAG: hypothetical protein A2046_00785 [Bacteroidetes bacterium GWA2_30_7]|nr:MAG: hypothetical protein A2046_00785 [Bacteroidetes bacterium GWA2_30_7]